METSQSGTTRAKRMGQVVASYRRAASVTQADLATLTGVKREYISSIELGRISVIYPDTFNRLRAVLGFPGFEVLELMGYQTDCAEEGVNSALLATLKQATLEQQKAILDLARTIVRLRPDDSNHASPAGPVNGGG